MRAARFYNQKDIRIEDVERPEPKQGQVLIDVEWCGICGSDLHEYLAGPIFIPIADRPHPLTGSSLPITLGHEFCGRVGKICSNSKFKVGQAVMVDPRLSCTACHACQNAAPNSCASIGFLGVSGRGGGLSETVVVDEENCYRVPDALLSEAAIIEPLTVGRHGLKSSGIKDFSNMTVLIIGGGPVGLAVLLNLKAVGVRQAIVSEPTISRHQICQQFADVVLNPTECRVVDECRRLTEGAGVDVVFDCAGIPAGLRDGMDALRVGGTWTNLAIWEVPLVLPLELWMLKELIVRASSAYTEVDFREVVNDFIEGKFKGAEKMVTSRIQLEEVAEKGFAELANNKDSQVKILVTPRRR